MFDFLFAFATNPSLFLAGVILAAVQFAAALPWLWATDPKAFARTFRSLPALGSVALGLLVAGAVIANFMAYKGDSASLEWYGRYGYGAILHLQLLIGLFLLLPRLAVALWPKGGAVAYAAYREACRQPMFWLIVLFAKLLIVVSVFIPYFTFGDDYKMMKQIGFDVVMLAAVLFGVLASSMSISEEIEGRTAVTLMSKPVNRRQFLIGKFLGILMACLVMSLLIAWTLNYALRAMPEFDKINEVIDPMPQQAERTVVPVFEGMIPAKAAAAKVVARGAGLWFADTLAHSLGLLLGFGQVMILVAIASALATRLPFVVNLVLCLVIYFLGHLAPVVVAVASQPTGGGAGLGLVGFLAQLFNVILPALEFFNMGPAIIRESPLDLWQFGGYVLTVFGYSVLYTAIALLVGLLLFEDRDLA
jgi:ABC-type transport system involved in multi-copper enzyme maturation permease subunit